MNKNIYKLTPDVVVVICDYSIREKLAKLLGETGLPVYFMLHGHGSASSELLEYLCIGEPKKYISKGITEISNVTKIYSLLNEELSISKKGRGIAFTIPVSSMNGLLYKVCTGQTNTEGGETQMQSDMEMIMTVVNKGEFATVMEAAKAAGATGGTMIHGRGLGGSEAEKFLGITINPEKDIVLILVPTAQKHTIMKAINEALTIGKAGNGICFALPVSSAFGLAPAK